MAFTTTVVSTIVDPGAKFNFYNVDFPVGAAARGNRTTDIMLVQALFRIMHFEVSKPITPPAGEKLIAVDGKLGPATMRFIWNVQRAAKGSGGNILIDGIVDPFREKGELSHIARVQYVLELINNTCAAKCREDGIDNFAKLPERDDIPAALRGELSLPKRKVARAYENQA